MIETPRQFIERCGPIPADNLARFSYHTGASLRALENDELCPILFRDVGPEAMAAFLRGELRQLCGPLSPVTYLRTKDYCEPYVDHGQIGRLVFLRPLAVGPWHSGVPSIYVAPRHVSVDYESVAFLPAAIPFAEAAHRLSAAISVAELAEEFGGRVYREACRETLASLDALNREIAESEQLAVPLRRLYQSPRQSQRDQAREQMARLGLTESDLCTAWHHLPVARRAFIREVLGAVCQNNYGSTAKS
ncbi:MAG: hypothetical protein JSS02_02955 [Planctomycetes bacterium]|nr:hypothetical protein [Planctomycetota bacterium]